jgi:hypothetical protein
MGILGCCRVSLQEECAMQNKLNDSFWFWVDATLLSASCAFWKREAGVGLW